MKKGIARKIKTLSKLKNCRKCLSTNLLHVKPDVFCLDCNWDSIIYYVSAGAMDNLKAAAIEHGFITRDHSLSNEISESNEQVKVAV